MFIEIVAACLLDIHLRGLGIQFIEFIVVFDVMLKDNLFMLCQNIKLVKPRENS